MFKVIKKTIFTIQLLALSVVFLSSCTTAQKDEPMQANWYSRMHRLSEAMTNLMPVSGDSRKFFDPKNTEMIQANLSQLATASAELAQDSSGPKDPIIQHTARIFAQDMDYANNQFKNGNAQTAQFMVGNISNYCISCHTRTDRGTKDFPLSWSANLNNLNDVQRTQFYLANRQYGGALKEITKVVKNSQSIKADPAQWRRTVEKTLAMLVRVEKNVEQTSRLAQAVLQNNSVPYYVRYDAYVWMNDIENWRKDIQKNAKNITDKQKYKMAVDLIEQSKVQQKPQSHSSLIAALRASALLHEILENTKSPVYVEALYYSGVAAELLRDISVWSLNETYYESCIRARPHSRIAQKCFVQIEASIHQSSSNSFLNPVMSNIQQTRLDELSQLSMISDKSINQMFRTFDTIDRSNNRN